MIHLFLAAVLVATPPQAEQPQMFTGIGTHGRSVLTTSPECQAYFNQGLNFLYAFNHDEALRSFRAAAAADSECAMAWWGIATANGPHINVPFVPEPRSREALDALRRANAIVPRIRNLKKWSADLDLIRAANARFADPPPDDRSTLDRNYASAMRAVWERHPKDADVGALFAEAMMDLRPWDLWRPDGKPQPGTSEVLRTLEAVLKLNAKHPLANHLYIHAVEASPNPGRGEKAANVLRDLQPGLGHMVHMPSHIDVRTGEWEKAILANQKAAKADDEYQERSRDQGIYRVYMAHNRHMLAFAAMMRGRSEMAITAVDEMVAQIPDDFLKEYAMFVDGFFAMPFKVRVRFGKWDEILALPEPRDNLPITRALRHESRAIAYAAKGMPSEARVEQARFYQARKDVPEDAAFGQNPASALLLVATHLMNGEIKLAEGDVRGSLDHLRAAVRAEDQLRYDEPPDWIQPTRHTLGVALLKAGLYREAEAVYREDLRRLPHNGWSLYGLSQALERRGALRESRRVRLRFEDAWKNADLSITSSCLCVPGG